MVEMKLEQDRSVNCSILNDVVIFNCCCSIAYFCSSMLFFSISMSYTYMVEFYNIFSYKKNQPCVENLVFYGRIKHIEIHIKYIFSIFLKNSS
jgi:hypothetical protein